MSVRYGIPHQIIQEEYRMSTSGKHRLYFYAGRIAYFSFAHNKFNNTVCNRPVAMGPFVGRNASFWILK